MKEQQKQESLQESASRRILITGVDGFTGYHLERFLVERGYEVYGTVLSNVRKENHYNCNILKKDEINIVLERTKPDFVFHLAGISFVGEANKSLIYDVNTIGAENLLDAIISSQIKPSKVIIPSSATVYGNQNTAELDELMYPRPVNHYGCSKLAMESIVSNYFNQLNIIITRPFNYTGPLQPGNFLIPKIISHFKEKKKIIELGNINVAREFNNVSDVCEIYFKLMKSDAKSIIVNVCSGREVFLKEIIENMSSIAGYSIKVQTNPDFVRKDEIPILKGSINKLSTIINFKFKKEIRDTLEEMYLY